MLIILQLKYDNFAKIARNKIDLLLLIYLVYPLIRNF
ncbi:hypothetical protein L3N51_02208 [Metallosphaera sp. J1]|nr:hypothetical protein [Metallosphaera javensis (ex Hofmann et al. 2022)]